VRLECLQFASIVAGVEIRALRLLLITFTDVNPLHGRELVGDAAYEAKSTAKAATLDQLSEATEFPLKSCGRRKRNQRGILFMDSHTASASFLPGGRIVNGRVALGYLGGNRNFAVGDCQYDLGTLGFRPWFQGEGADKFCPENCIFGPIRRVITSQGDGSHFPR
jgi:hypothetical protein